MLQSVVDHSEDVRMEFLKGRGKRSKKHSKAILNSLLFIISTNLLFIMAELNDWIQSRSSFLSLTLQRKATMQYKQLEKSTEVAEALQENGMMIFSLLWT